MEYLAGSLITFVGISVFYYLFKLLNTNVANKIKLKSSQSYNHKLFAPILLDIRDYRPRNTQSTQHQESNKTRILFTQDTAYWIKDNAVYCANVDPQTGLILEESTKEVDTMGMDKVQLDEMMFIVEQLTEGQRDDNWSSGDS